MLTRMQSKLLSFLHDSIEETGVTPSFDEMRSALDLHSKSGVHRLICALEERGFIRRLRNRDRAIEVLRPPGADRALDAAYNQGYERGYKLGFDAGKASAATILADHLAGYVT